MKLYDLFYPEGKAPSTKEPTMKEFAERTSRIAKGNFSDRPIIVNRFPHGMESGSEWEFKKRQGRK